MQQLRKLSVVIPVFNEEPTVETLIRRVLAVELPKEVVVVDDASMDQTPAILNRLAQEPGMTGTVVFLQHSHNRGKGAAIRTALERVEGDVVIIQDADLEYDPREFPNLLEPILDGRADVVYGSRFLGGPHRVLYFWHYLGNKTLTLLSNILTNLNLSDMETCYKAFRSEVLQGVTIRSNRFEFEPEITIKVARRGYRIYETPISYSGRSYAEGKKIGWKDGVRTLWALIRFRFFD